MGGISHFFLQTVWAQVWPDRSKLLETLTFFSDFFLEMKAPIGKTAGAQAGLGICCLNVSKANFT